MQALAPYTEGPRNSFHASPTLFGGIQEMGLLRAIVRILEYRYLEALK